MESNEKITALCQEIGLLLIEAVRKKMNQKPWNSAFLDQRFPPEGGPIGLNKCRIVLPDNSVVRDMPDPRGSEVLILKAFELRTAKLQSKDWWYGFLITVFPDARCEVKFFYDPNHLNEMELET